MAHSYMLPTHSQLLNSPTTIVIDRSVAMSASPSSILQNETILSRLRLVEQCITRISGVFDLAHAFCQKSPESFERARNQFLDRKHTAMGSIRTFYLDQADNILFLVGSSLKMIQNMIWVCNFVHQTSNHKTGANLSFNIMTSRSYSAWKDMCQKWCKIPTNFPHNAAFAFEHWWKFDASNAFKSFKADPKYSLTDPEYTRGVLLAKLNSLLMSKSDIPWNEFTSDLLLVFLNTRCLQNRRSVMIEWSEMMHLARPSGLKIKYEKCGTIKVESQAYIYFLTHFVLAVTQYGCAEMNPFSIFANNQDLKPSEKKVHAAVMTDILKETTKWLIEWFQSPEERLEEHNREIVLEVATANLLLVSKSDSRMSKAPMQPTHVNQALIVMFKRYGEKLHSLMQAEGSCVPKHLKPKSSVGHTSLTLMTEYHLHQLVTMFLVAWTNSEMEELSRNADFVSQVGAVGDLVPSGNPEVMHKLKRKRTDETFEENDPTDDNVSEEQHPSKLRAILRDEGVLLLRNVLQASEVDDLRQNIVSANRQTTGKVKNNSWLINPHLANSCKEKAKIEVRIVGGNRSTDAAATIFRNAIQSNTLLNCILKDLPVQNEDAKHLSETVRALTSEQVHLLDQEVYIRQKIKSANTAVHADYFYYRAYGGMFEECQRLPHKQKEEMQRHCKVCEDKNESHLSSTNLICDICQYAFHNSCLPRPLVDIPNGEWHCHSCSNSLMDAFTVWIPLQDIETDKDSCLVVIPGSHKWQGFDHDLSDRFWVPSNDKAWSLKWKTPQNGMKQGDIIIFHTKLIHAASTHQHNCKDGTTGKVRNSMDVRFFGTGLPRHSES